jgi:phosphoribosyl-AMP cyclohydrolase
VTERYTLDPRIAARLTFDDRGLVCAVVQQFDTREVLMVAWMSEEALARTLATREGTYWSRSRAELWIKGATSGHVQKVHEVRLDCDGDTVLVLVDQSGAACHTGDHTCFDADQLLAPEA